MDSAGVGQLPPEDVHCEFGADWFDLKALGNRLRLKDRDISGYLILVLRECLLLLCNHVFWAIS